MKPKRFVIAAPMLALFAYVATTGFAIAQDGVFSWAGIGSGNQDANVGLSTSKTYLNAVDAGGWGGIVNGVTFARGNFNGNPSGSNYAVTGAGSTYYRDPINLGGELGKVVLDFVYGGTQTVTLSGLTAGETYTTSFYNFAFDSAADARQQAITTTGGANTTFSQNFNGYNNANVLRYSFTASGASEAITFTPLTSGASFHNSAFTTEQAFNKSFVSGSNWTTSTWSTAGNPNGVGANADFVAQASPTTLNLDASRTVGNLRFAGAQAWTLSGSNTLTLQADVGGRAILAAASGTHTIATPTALNSDLWVTGEGSLALSGQVGATASGITKSGSGTLVLSAANAYSGVTDIQKGTVLIANSSALGTGGHSQGTMTWIRDGATLALQGNISSGEHFHAWGSGVGGLGAIRSISGNNALTNVDNSGGAGYALRSQTTVGVDAGSLSVSGFYESGGSYGLTKVGAGTLTITHNSTYTGATTVNGGRLQLDASTGDKVYAGGAVAINNGSTLAFSGGRYDWNTSGGSAKVVTFGASGGNTLDTGTSNNIVDWVGNTYRTTGGARNFITGSSGFNVNSGVTATLDVARGTDPTSDLTVSSFFWNGGGIAKTGNGIATLSGSSTYTGESFINAGTLVAENNNALGAGGFLNGTKTTVADGATLALQGNISMGEHTHLFGSGVGGQGVIRNLSGTNTLTSHHALRSNVALGADAGQLTISGGLYESGGNFGVTKVGVGAVVLGGSNTYTGESFINAGTLVAANNNALGAGGFLADTKTTVADGATLALQGNVSMDEHTHLYGSGVGGQGAIRNLSGTNTLTSNHALKSNVALGADAGQLSISGSLYDEGGNFGVTKVGAGAVVLGGSNTYSGGTTISAGTLQVGNGGTTGTLGTGNVTNNASLVVNRANALSLSNTISGTGSLVQAGTGTTTLSGANTYTGGTTVNAGALALGANNRLADSGAVTVNAGALDLGGFSDTVGAVTLAGGSIANGTLTGSSYDVRSGNASAVLAGSSALTKSTAGTVTLSGANIYTGGTTVNAGRLATSGNERLADSGAVTVNTNATFAIGGDETIASLAGAGAVELGGTLTTGANNSTYSGSMSGLGGLTKSGAGTFTLSGASTFTGDTTLSGGTLVLDNANALWTGGVLSMDAGTTLTVNQRTFVGALDQGGGTVNGPGQLVATLTLTESGALNAVLADGPDFAAGILKRTAGTTTVGAANTFTGAVNVQGGTLQLGAGGSFDAASTLALSAGATMDLGNKAQTFAAVSGAGGTVAMGSGALTVNGTNNSQFAGAITGTGNFTKAGSGTATLTGASTYTGGTTISDGTLQVGNGGTGGTLGTGAVTNNASLAFNRSDSSSVANTISGSGAVSKAGSGTIILTADNSYSGTTTIGEGTLQVGNGGTTGTLGSGAVVNNGVLDFNRSGNHTVANAMSGSGATVKNGAGTATLTANNTATGDTTVNAGTLQVGNGGTSGAVGGNIVNNGAVAFNRSDASTYAGGISGTGSVSKLGSGTMTLSGTSTYSGATAVNAGTLVVDGSADNSTVTVNSGATLSGSGSIGGLIVSSGGTINPGNSPGTQTVAGNATWSAGGNYNWQILDAAGSAGTGWDLLNVTGTLDLSSLSLGNEFEINLWSLSSIGPDVSGNALNFNSGQNYTWTIASAASGITGFTGSNQFSINTAANNGAAGFANALNGGSFSIAQSGNDLNLVFTAAVVPPGPAAVPEPGTWAAAALLAGGAYLRWRKRRQAHGEEAKA